jgi:hypothetical protein
MMGAYAIVKDGIVINIVEWDGVPSTPAVEPDENGEGGAPASGWSPPEGAVAIRVEEGEFPCIGLGYANGVFEQPAAPVRTPDQIKADNTATRDSMLASATAAIAPLQDAVDLEEATADEVAQLKLWKQFRIAVNRVDLTQAAPPWPIAPSL